LAARRPVFFLFAELLAPIIFNYFKCLFMILSLNLQDVPDDPRRFKVVRTDGDDEVVGCATNLIIGRAAYETYPSHRVDYRDEARILARSDQADGD
jgi:hypothetical protein